MQNNFLLADLKDRAWALEPRAFESLIKRIAALSAPDFLSKIGAEAAQPGRLASRPALDVADGVATIKISGLLLDKIPGWIKIFGDLLGVEATAYGDILRGLNEALADDKVKSIVLDVNSPGGIVDGVQNVASAIFAGGKKKEITARVGSLAASAAYWLASQAKSISAAPTAEIGSIGIYLAVEDWSRFYENAGVKVNVLRSGPFKGTGVEGSPITDAELEPLQDTIDGLAQLFIHDVARGRGMLFADVQKLASGRAWLAADAKKLGLIDEILGNETIESPEVRASESEMFFDSKGEAMAEEKKSEAAAPAIDIEAVKAQSAKEAKDAELARFNALLAAFPGDAAFAAAQFGDGAGVEQAKAAFADVQTSKLAAAKAEIEKLAGELAKKAAAPKGAEPLATDGVEPEASGLRPDEELKRLAIALAKDKGISYAAAAAAVVKERPELYAKLKPRKRD